MSATRTIFLRLCLFAAATASLHAQFAFSYRSLATPTPATVDNNGSINFPAALVGSSSDVTVIGRNTTSEAWKITSAAVTSPAFKLGSVPTDAPALNTFLLNVTFTPTSASQATATLTIKLVSTGAAATNVTYNFFLFAGGQAPQLVSSYIMNPDGNQVPLRDSDLIAFPPTVLRASATATVVIVNRGNGPGAVRSVSLTGDAFKLSGLPLLPAQVDSNKEVRFNVVFTPLVRDPASGALRVELNDRTLDITLTGQGTGAVLSYEFSTTAGVIAANPEDTLHLPGAALGATTNGVLRVRNSGNADARVAAVSVVGTAFRVVDLPPLPVTLPQGAVFAITIAFTPRDSGLSTGRLLIDSVSFPLDGMGTGSRLTFSSRTGAAATPIPDGGSVSLPNTTVGDTSSVFILITNVGNAPGTVSAISAGPAAFTLSSLPALPLTVQSGQTVEFVVAFAPTAVGSITGTLQIDDRAISLRGVGNTPPALPGVTFTGLPDTTAPLQQPAVGITLAQPYALDLTGKLTLTFTSDSFVDDPSVQFATGGRTVDFRIPANSTQAVFGESARTVQFQAGTVAGVIAVSATFTAGAANVTPTAPPSKSVLLPASAPQIRNVQVGTRTNTSFELLITGYSTARSVSQFTLNFAAANGANLGTTSLTVNVEAPFTSWYQSAAGRTFGSQFTASVIINVTGDIAAVDSVTVTASNSRGASNAVTASLR